MPSVPNRKSGHGSLVQHQQFPSPCTHPPRPRAAGVSGTAGDHFRARSDFSGRITIVDEKIVNIEELIAALIIEAQKKGWVTISSTE